MSTTTSQRGTWRTGSGDALDAETLTRIDQWWRAANYLSVGQIYLLDNPLLREPLTRDHVKPRLLGHWGTTPGPELPLRAPQPRDRRARAVDASTSPAPATAAPASSRAPTSTARTPRYYSDITEDSEGIHRLFRQFSFPGGIPSHVAPETPGSIHEGGELGYALSHAYGAAFDNPDLLVATVIGDGEAETGPLATSWHSNKFVNAENDGVVLPILHLNGYKIANPTVLARIPEDELASLMVGYGHKPHMFVAGFDDESHEDIHRRFATLLDEVLDEIAEIKRSAHAGNEQRPQWPMIVFRTPKGWTGPDYIDGKKTTGSWRAHQVPLASARDTPEHLDVLRQWLRVVPGRRAVRRGRQAARRHPRARPQRAPADERQPARQRRPAAQGPAPAGLPRVRGRRAGAGRLDERGDARAGRLAHRRHPAQPRQLPDLRSRRDGVEPPAVGVPDHGQAVERRVLRRATSTSTWRAPAA